MDEPSQDMLPLERFFLHEGIDFVAEIAHHNMSTLVQHGDNWYKREINELPEKKQNIKCKGNVKSMDNTSEDVLPLERFSLQEGIDLVSAIAHHNTTYLVQYGENWYQRKITELVEQNKNLQIEMGCYLVLEGQNQFFRNFERARTLSEISAASES